MKNTGIILIISMLIITSSSCKKKKDEWKLPTDVGFTMDINRSTSSDGDLVFNGGTIILASFSVEGEREQGVDINFFKEWPGGLSIGFSPSGVISAIDFDIPQGTYSRIEIEFDTFDDLGDNCILVNGTFTNSAGTPIAVRFEFKSSEYFSITAKESSGGSLIVLDKDVPATSKIVLDPIHWFQIVSNSLMENADIVSIDGVPTIIISEDVNENIFDLVIDRLDEATEAIFNF